jgi:hypothetical protein
MNKKTQNESNKQTTAQRRKLLALRRELRLTPADKKDAFKFINEHVVGVLAKTRIKPPMQKRIAEGLADMYVAVMATYVTIQKHDTDKDEVLAAIVAKLGCTREDGSALPDPRVSGALVAEETVNALEGAADHVDRVLKSVKKAK